VFKDCVGAGRVFVADGEGANGFASVADLVPVVVLVVDGVAALDALEPRVDPLGGDRVLDGGAVAGRDNGVEPVVAKAESCGHFAGIEKVGRIPVGKGRGGQHLLRGAVGVALVTGDAIDAGKRKDAAFHVARGLKQRVLDAPDEVDIGRNGQQVVGVVVEGVVLIFDEGIGSDRALECGHIGVVQEEARMLGLQCVKLRGSAALEWNEKEECGGSKESFEQGGASGAHEDTFVSRTAGL
jgi:hypothetical protein